MCLPRPKQSFFAMESVKICRFKTSIFPENLCTGNPCLFPFRYFSIHVKMRGLLTYSVIKWV